jgi:hypothetical protein
MAVAPKKKKKKLLAFTPLVPRVPLVRYETFEFGCFGWEARMEETTRKT